MRLLTSKNIKLIASIIFIAMLFLGFLVKKLEMNISALDLIMRQNLEVESSANHLIELAINNESNTRAYILTGKQQFLDQRNTAELDFSSTLKKLGQKIPEISPNKNWTDSLKFYFEMQSSYDENLISLKRMGKTDEAIAKVTSSFSEKVISLFNEISNEQKHIFEDKKEQSQSFNFYIQLFIYSIIAASFCLILYFLFLLNNYISGNQKLVSEVKDLAQMEEESTDAIFALSTDLIFTKWNKGAEKKFGYNKEEIIGKVVGEVEFIKIEPTEIKIIEANVYQYGFVKMERIFYHKNGNSFYGLATANLLKDNKGKPVFFYFSVKDISRQKELEKKLETANEKLETLLVERTEQLAKSDLWFRIIADNTNEFISLTDENMKVIFRNKANNEVFGAENNKDLLESIHQDDRILIINIFPEIKNNPGKWFPVIFRRKNLQGKYITLEGEIINFLQVDGLNAIYIKFRDVTKRIEAEEKLANSELLFRTIIESISEGISMSDEHLNPIFRNPAAVKMIGDINGKRSIESIHPDDREQIRRKHGEALQNHAHHIPFEARFLNSNGHYLYLEGNIVNMLQIPGINAVISNYRDITRIKESENAFKTLNATLEDKVSLRTDQLQKANEEMSAFTYSVSHDLRAPLRGIIGFTRILEEEYTNKLDDEAKRITAIISKNAKSMGDLIDDLLRFSRISKQELKKIVFDTNSLIEKIINEQIEAKIFDTKIQWKIDTLQPTFGDPTTIRQVWFNLISNAIKYSGNKSESVIEIGCYSQNKQIVFFIKDNGVGFDIKYGDKLFKIFQRLHNSAEFEGTGIGLAIVEKIISRHGGKVWADGIVNQGACFSFSLPQEFDNTKLHFKTL